MSCEDNEAPHLPLKRHASLQPLSREHMGGLILARSLKRAADGTAEDRRRAIDAFVAQWTVELRPHFDDEERLLLPLTDRADLCERLVAEHRALREWASRCEQHAGEVAREAEPVRRIGVLLHDHIRWEEREFFEAIQRDHPEALDRIVRESAEIENHRPGTRARSRLDGPNSQLKIDAP